MLSPQENLPPSNRACPTQIFVYYSGLTWIRGFLLMVPTATTCRWRSLSAPWGRSVGRAIVAYGLLCSAAVGSPQLLLQPPELEEVAESSVQASEFACMRAQSVRLRGSHSYVYVERHAAPVEAKTAVPVLVTRGFAPCWLRNDLAAPLLC